jgi:PTH1 family peptidyl-tRNA hydrolase
VKPLTFMNLSGEAVAAFLRSEGISSEEFVLAYDDMDIPLGKLRISQGGGSAGHNGVESVIQETGTANFARMRLGIGSGCEIMDRKDFVLSDFSEGEMKMFQDTLEMAMEAAVMILKRGVGKAMNDFNGRDAVEFAENRNKKK